MKERIDKVVMISHIRAPLELAGWNWGAFFTLNYFTVKTSRDV